MERKNDMNFEYYYGHEAEQFSFYRIPLSFLILRFLTGCKAYWNDINAFEVGCE